MIYVVTMYRWGSRESHSYVIGGYNCLNAAIAAGEAEAYGRAGKYEYEAIGLDNHGNIFEYHSEKSIKEGTISQWAEKHKADFYKDALRKIENLQGDEVHRCYEIAQYALDKMEEVEAVNLTNDSESEANNG